ncbi:MAG TPA: tRNA (N6-isopentenyl adenosine(37)-C2)-methylthiotransferase MiaB, partial [Gemmatimonadales bacterium]|nr:tRNA (N6-isopentenyl adenosine(37)-C2)-methylthiotransferase MiaB [Gemmatimonadales bacterium]
PRALTAMPRVYIETYGCQMNVADSELMFGVLGRAGYERVELPDEADVMLVNTCAVRDNAEQRVIGRVGELQRHKRPGDLLGVVGCMAQRLGPALLERVAKVDLVVGPDAYRNLPALLAQAGAGERPHDTGFRSWEHYEDVPAVREPGATQFVTVQRGCDYRCTFCIVPTTRGPERSRKLEDVVREVRDLAAQGTTEVTLLGQTVNSWTDGTHQFGALLRAVGAVEGIRRVRFTSPYPTDFTDEVVAAMAEIPAVCEHVHLPAQSGSDTVLKRMLRRYRRAEYLEVVARLRAAIPGITFSTDLIVGFPGETEAEFAETLSLVAEAGFDEAYTFKYSPRDGTPAVRMRDHVDDAVASDRLDRLIGAMRDQARRRNLGRVGEVHEVLVERPAKRGGLLLGRTRTNLLVLLDLPATAIGSYRSVRLSGTTGSTFTGELLSEAPALAVL